MFRIFLNELLPSTELETSSTGWPKDESEKIEWEQLEELGMGTSSTTQFLTCNTENISHLPFETTQEIKVIYHDYYSLVTLYV